MDELIIVDPVKNHSKLVTCKNLMFKLNSNH